MDKLTIVHLNDKAMAVLVGRVSIGDILMSEDGYYQFWPGLRGGYWPAYMMRALADKVDALNAEWDKQVQGTEP